MFRSEGSISGRGASANKSERRRRILASVKQVWYIYALEVVNEDSYVLARFYIYGESQVVEAIEGS